MENTISVGRSSALIKKTICIPQSYEGFGLFAGCIFVNTGPSELLNLSVHKCRTRSEREKNVADEILYMLLGETKHILGSVLWWPDECKQTCYTLKEKKTTVLREDSFEMVNVSGISELDHTNAHIREVSVCVGNGLHGQLCVIKPIITPPVSKHLSGPQVQTPDAHVCTNQLRMHMRTHMCYHFCSFSFSFSFLFYQIKFLLKRCHL